MACLQKSEDKLKYEPLRLLKWYLLSVHARGYMAQELPGILLSVFYLAYNFCGYRHIYRVSLAFLSSGNLKSGSHVSSISFHPM